MSSRPVLAGLRGWTLVGALSAALVGTVAVQLPAATAGTPAAVPAAAAGTTLGTGAGTPAPVGTTAARPGGTSAVPVAPPAATAAPAREARVAGTVARAAADARTAAARRTAAQTVSAPGAVPAGTCSGPGWQARRGAAALTSLRAAPSPASALRFRPARAGFLGLTHLDSRTVEVFVRPCASESDALLRHVVAHELGHARDAAAMTRADRAAYLRARGIPAGTPWTGCDRCTDFATPAGDFAETYAQWRRGATSSRSRMAPAPGPAALEALARRFFGA